MNKAKYILTLVLFLSIGLSACSGDKQAKDKIPTKVTMYKNPECKCCLKWAAYMEDNGFSVTQKPTNSLASIKYQYGVPNNLGSCHTALIDGYIVEGHVPAEDVKRMLREQPDAKGIAVVGMPGGAPGTQGEKGSFEVLLFDAEGFYSVYARH